MHSGFANLRSALPMNLKARHQGFKVWAGAQADIERVTAIWRDCLQRYGGPVPVRRDADDGRCHVRAGLHPLRHLRREARSCLGGLSRPDPELAGDARMDAAAKAEPEEVEELDVEF